MLLSEPDLREANALVLKWHGSDLTVGYEAFRTWVLATLKEVLVFDGAIWGLLPHGAALEDGVCGARLRGMSAAALDSLTSARPSEFSSRLAVGEVSNVCVEDARWCGPEHARLQEHARAHGMPNSLLTRFSGASSQGQQFVMITRSDVTRRFSDANVALFELLAPHMMQAYATRRKWFLEQLRPDSPRDRTAAVAVVDRAGFVHDKHARFDAMFRREWSDWKGDRVPAHLQELAGRHHGARWRFIGQQIVAEFLPVDESYVVSARPRSPADDLTDREFDIARRYAAGGNFREVAVSLSLAPATVRSHLRNVFVKLQIRNKAQLADLLR